jgi:hypothetical protein
VSGVQLRHAAELPFDPVDLSRLSILERAELYAALDLHPIQREAAEAAVRAVLRGEYGRAGR